MNNKIFIIAGESSGDMYGAYLAEHLNKQNPNAELQGWGGDRMKQSGVQILKHISELSFMGFTEVLKRSTQIRKHFIECKANISAFKPDVVIFIDYPGFNLRMAPWVKSQGIKTIQYVAPKVWAWNEGRLKKLAKYIDTIICIFPFEVNYFHKRGLNVHYFGNPLVEKTNAYKANKPVMKSDYIALMPGSRQQEVKRILPIMVEIAQKLPNKTFIIGGLTLLGKDIYQNILGSSANNNISIIYNDSYNTLTQCECTITTSGTITLEAALLGIPQIVVYKTHQLSYEVGKRLIKIPYISLPNILLEKQVVQELIQKDLNIERLLFELENLTNNKAQIMKDYESIQYMLTCKDKEEKLTELILSC